MAKLSRRSAWRSVCASNWSAITNIVIVDDALRVEDFLLGRNFSRAFQELVDLTTMKIVVRAPMKSVWRHTHTQVGNINLAVPVIFRGPSKLRLFVFRKLIRKIYRKFEINTKYGQSCNPKKTSDDAKALGVHCFAANVPLHQ